MDDPNRLFDVRLPERSTDPAVSLGVEQASEWNEPTPPPDPPCAVCGHLASRHVPECDDCRNWGDGGDGRGSCA